MSETLKRLDAAFEKVANLEGDLEAFLADGNEADLVMKSGGEATIRDGILALRNLVVRLAGALTEKSVKTEAEKVIQKAIEEKLPAAAQLQLPQGAIVCHGDRPEELSVLVLRKANSDLLTKLVRGAGKSLAGGSDDALAVVEKVAPAKHLDHWDSRPYAYEGFPEIGTVIVKSVDEAGLLTKAAQPTEPEGELAGLGSYLLRAAQTKRNAMVRLVGEGDPRATKAEE
jgi:hypothetical protein